MILMKEYVSLITAAMKMSKRHFYSDHSNSCSEESMLHWVIPGPIIPGLNWVNHPGHVTLTSWIF